jgi:hypothetical protein
MFQGILFLGMNLVNLKQTHPKMLKRHNLLQITNTIITLIAIKTQHHNRKSPHTYENQHNQLLKSFDKEDIQNRYKTKVPISLRNIHLPVLSF